MRYFEDYVLGQRVDVGSFRLKRDDIIEFASRWDPQPFHLGDAAAKDSIFGELIASGCHLVAMSINLISNSEERGCVLAALGGEEVRFIRPVRPDEPVFLTVECVEARPSESKPDRGIIKNRLTLTNHRQQIVLRFTDVLFVARRPEG